MKKAAVVAIVCAISIFLCACGKTTEIRITGGYKEQNNSQLVDAALFYSTEDGFLHKGRPDGAVFESEYYSGNGKELTLSGLDLVIRGNCGIYFKDDVSLVLSPGTENSISLETDTDSSSAYALDAEKSLSIVGGKLEINTLGTCELVGGIACAGDLEIKNCSLSLSSVSAARGSYCIYCDGDLAVSESRISAGSGDAAYPYCIVCRSFVSDGSDLNLSCGKCTETTLGTSCCVYAENDIRLVSGSWSFACGKADKKISLYSENGAIYGDFEAENYAPGETRIIYN
ncbi:MAG: hypothetical protein II104_04805 [Oscillospiraceae bacterium]|jgi:hypothetical protein|nr:hypothetical protein [Oscillospiraceae bacterium]